MSNVTKLIDEVGALVSDASAALADARANNPAVDLNANVRRAHDIVAQLGLKVLAARHASVQSADGASAQTQQPTTRVVDVGGGGGGGGDGGSSSGSGPREYFSALKQGEVYQRSGAGKCKLSWAISSGGYPCFASFDPNNMGPAYTGGTPWLESPDGSWVFYFRYDADPGRVQDAHVDIMPA